MINHTIRTIIEMERYPRFCKECPAFHTHPYTCHNERGLEATCTLGYMTGHDMRDFYGDTCFSGCEIETNPDVTITKGETND